ncbi:Na/Pi cotransporter family protein [Laceyella putida]|uniref:Na/Pi cotransporter family protein n=1 Tax=Laceyella putida TaxID=110101 RepID=A0ABW2RIR6_9BACL
MIWTTIILPFCIGLAIFLYGLGWMRTGLEALARERLHQILLQFTRTPLRGFITGILTTACLQSSTAVTVLTIGFVNAGILSFAHTIGIILGSNIGTTITTQMLTLNIEDFAIPLFVIGLVLRLFPQEPLQLLGKVLLGFGAIFWGIHLMQLIAAPLKEQGWVEWFIQHSGNPVVSGLLVGMLLTALIHSSSACIAITMGFYATGVITLPFAIAVVFGSNVGTCVTAMIASIGANMASKQVALAHLLLNVGGAAIFTPMIPLICEISSHLSSDPATQIAHIQTLFNVICSVAVLPFCDAFASVITRLIPDESFAWQKKGGFNKPPSLYRR